MGLLKVASRYLPVAQRRCVRMLVCCSVNEAVFSVGPGQTMTRQMETYVTNTSPFQAALIRGPAGCLFSIYLHTEDALHSARHKSWKCSIKQYGPLFGELNKGEGFFFFLLFTSVQPKTWMFCTEMCLGEENRVCGSSPRELNQRHGHTQTMHKQKVGRLPKHTAQQLKSSPSPRRTCASGRFGIGRSKSQG